MYWSWSLILMYSLAALELVLAEDAAESDKEGHVEVPLCYHCSYMYQHGADGGDAACKQPTSDNPKLVQACPSAICAVQRVNQGGLYQVVRYCFEDCQESYVESHHHTAHVSCCKGSLCNTAHKPKPTLTVMIFVLALAAYVMHIL